MGDGEFKQPYLYGEAKSALETPMQAEIYSNSPEMESQWKQPWKYDNYPKMEAEMSFPGAPSYPQYPGGYAGGDCTPQGDAVGGGATDPCQPGVNCGQWVFNCAHRITSFGVVQSFGWIQSAVYGANDTVAVTVCWNEADRIAGVKVGVKAVGMYGQNYISEVDMNTCCPDKAVCQTACGSCATLSIGHSTHQMTCGGSTQALTASGGGGKYVWTLFGGGSLSKNIGPTTVYTPPTTNANCANNAEITLGDCCGTKVDLKIAVNCAATDFHAYEKGLSSWCTPAVVGSGYYCRCPDSGDNNQIVNCGFTETAFNCANAVSYQAAIASQIANCVGVQNCPDVLTETDLNNVAHTYTAWKTILIDLRTDAQKLAGCCPEGLL